MRKLVSVRSPTCNGCVPEKQPFEGPVEELDGNSGSEQCMPSPHHKAPVFKGFESFEGNGAEKPGNERCLHCSGQSATECVETVQGKF